jgi:hypothetical protein
MTPEQEGDLTPEQEADINELADLLENTIVEGIEKRAVNDVAKGGDMLIVFEALLSMFGGRLAFIDSMFEQYCLSKYCPLPPQKTYYD